MKKWRADLVEKLENDIEQMKQKREESGEDEIETDISVRNWFSQGWKAYKNNSLPLILGSIVISIYGLIIGRIGLITEKTWIILFSQYFISSILSVGWFFLCLNIVRGYDAKFIKILDAFKKYVKVWGTYILLSLIVMGGTFLLVVPGIIWGLKYGLSLFIVMDDSLIEKRIFKYSNKITKGYRTDIFIALLFASLLMLPCLPFGLGFQGIGGDKAFILLIIGILPLLFSMVVIMPWIGTTFASVYESLMLENESKDKVKEKKELKEEKEETEFEEKVKRAKALKEEREKAEKIMKDVKKKTKGKRLF